MLLLLLEFDAKRKSATLKIDFQFQQYIYLILGQLFSLLSTRGQTTVVLVGSVDHFKRSLIFLRVSNALNCGPALTSYNNKKKS